MTMNPGVFFNPYDKYRIAYKTYNNKSNTRVLFRTGRLRHSTFEISWKLSLFPEIATVLASKYSL